MHGVLWTCTVLLNPGWYYFLDSDLCLLSVIKHSLILDTKYLSTILGQQRLLSGFLGQNLSSLFLLELFNTLVGAVEWGLELSLSALRIFSAVHRGLQTKLARGAACVPPAICVGLLLRSLLSWCINLFGSSWILILAHDSWEERHVTHVKSTGPIVLLAFWFLRGADCWSELLCGAYSGTFQLLGRWSLSLRVLFLNLKHRISIK